MNLFLIIFVTVVVIAISVLAAMAAAQKAHGTSALLIIIAAFFLGIFTPITHQFGAEAYALKVCVADVSGKENWANMSNAELRRAAEAAVSDQSVAPPNSDRVSQRCFDRLQKQTTAGD